MKHPYADILIAIAEGKEIQFQTVANGWQDMDTPDVLGEIANEDHDSDRYRIKPATITINDVTCEAFDESGDYIVSILGGGTKRVNVGFSTPEARDAAYAALIKPFESES